MDTLVKILVVEDEMIIGAKISLQLTNLGYEVTALLSRGEEVLQHVIENEPDIILLDINLRGKLDGIETAAQLQQLGWTDQAYSQFYSTASLIGGVAGMLMGGILIDRFGKKRMLNIYFFLLIALTSGLVFLNSYWINTAFISGFMIIFQVLYVFSNIGIFATAMQCCWKKVSASQFTLYMTIANLGRIAGASLIGPVKNQLSWQYTLFLFASMIMVAWLIIQFIHLDQQVKRVADLENKDGGTIMTAITNS